MYRESKEKLKLFLELTESKYNIKKFRPQYKSHYIYKQINDIPSLSGISMIKFRYLI